MARSSISVYPGTMVRQLKILLGSQNSLITTPNVSHAGSVIKILLGRSNYERLDRSPMYLQENEWRGHIRFYDKRELDTLFGRHDLQLVHHRYRTERGWNHARKTLVETGKTLIKSPLSWIPRKERPLRCLSEKLIRIGLTPHPSLIQPCSSCFGGPAGCGPKA